MNRPHVAPEGSPTAYGKRSILPVLLERYRRQWGTKLFWKLPPETQSDFLQQLSEEGLGKPRYLEQLLMLLALPDSALELHAKRVLGIDHLKRLNRLSHQQRMKVISELESGVRPRAIPELRPSLPQPDTALRQILRCAEARLPVIESQSIALFPAEKASLKTIVAALAKINRKLCK